MMTAYELGYQAFNTPGMVERVAMHFKGERLDRPAEWFQGFQDAADDAFWSSPAQLKALAKWERDNVDMV